MFVRQANPGRNRIAGFSRRPIKPLWAMSGAPPARLKPDTKHVNEQSGDQDQERERHFAWIGGKRQDDEIHHRVNENPIEQPSDDRMMSEDRDRPARQIENRRSRQSDTEMENETERRGRQTSAESRRAEQTARYPLQNANGGTPRRAENPIA